MVIARGVGRKLAVVALLSTAVVACDDNPLTEGRDKASYFRINPTSVAVNAGGTVKVDAIVVNQYGAATNQAVTATPCDNKINAAADTGRSKYEYPERFVISGVSGGITCLRVSGGGIQDSVGVRVVPASLAATPPTGVRIGQTGTLQVQFLGADGSAVQGFSMSDLTFTSSAGTIATVSPAGVVTGVAAGNATITVALHSRFGVTRTTTAIVAVAP
jgi:uncharacterized protein YjdB